MQNKVKKYIRALQGIEKNDPQKLKRSFVPDSLFKYRPLNENTLDCLRKNSVWMVSAESQNDPFDSSLIFDDREFTNTFFNRPNFKSDFNAHYGAKISDTEIQQIITHKRPYERFIEICKSKKVERIYDDLGFQETRRIESEQFINKIKRELHLSCFSERNDSILMWSHYASNHKGICIEYDFRNEPYILNFLEPVFYSNQLTSLSKALANRDYKGLPKVAAITKAMDWQYENEWRIIFPIRKQTEIKHFKVPVPKAIYLGAKYEDNNVETQGLKDDLKKLGIPIIQMRLHSSEYKIVE